MRYLCALGCYRWLRLHMLTSGLGEDDVRPGECYIVRICVRASVRGRGIGSQLLAVAEREALGHGCDCIWLWAWAQNPACRLYERHGFRVELEDAGSCMSWAALGLKGWKAMRKQLAPVIRSRPHFMLE